jgi:hypothetical protein
MAGRHVDNETLTGTVRNALERISHLGMVTSRNKRRPHLLYELDELVSGKLLALHLRKLIQLS